MQGGRFGPRSKIREKTWLALLLAWVAGTVDAVGYLVLADVFTAHMSGNSVKAGLYLGQSQMQEVVPHLVPIPLFVVGVALGTFITEIVVRRRARAVVFIMLGIECLLLLAFMLVGNLFIRGASVTDQSWQFYLLLALAVLSMGLQTATLQRVGGKTVRTTYVTGMLTNSAQESVRYLFWLRDHTRGQSWSRIRRVLRVSPLQDSFRQATRLGAIWLFYVAGAIWGGYGEQFWRLETLIIPLCILFGVAIADLIRPLYIPLPQ